MKDVDSNPAHVLNATMLPNSRVYIPNCDAVLSPEKNINLDQIKERQDRGSREVVLDLASQHSCYTDR